MAISLIFSILTHNFFFLLYAFVKSIFLYGFGFTSHGTLITDYLIWLQQKSISRNLHTPANIDNITHKDEILV